MITYPPELLPQCDEDDEAEVVVVCLECGVDDGTRGSENLCEACALMWMSRKRGWTVH